MDLSTTSLAYIVAAAAIVAPVLLLVSLAYRRQSAREREASEAVRVRLQAAINAVPVEFVEYDKDRRLILANQAARNVSPWRTPGTAGGKTIDEVFNGLRRPLLDARDGGGVDAMGGADHRRFRPREITAENRPEGGARFRIELPAVKVAALAR